MPIISSLESFFLGKHIYTYVHMDTCLYILTNMDNYRYWEYINTCIYIFTQIVSVELNEILQSEHSNIITTQNEYQNRNKILPAPQKLLVPS